ncbi:DNA polymerase III subunit alpha [Paenibacillus sp. FSL W8-0186]|uniref:DNA polymerase III subunit alpha n=1 Tax=Paenibacillus woosongensis TaxID=307580 RepID=A0A7X2YXM4_9BACL|nr:DNA polymerase III subunit alpha [Paenibacillus woosongensis]MUG43779.1 DNA polymerase III subunit alpha [Paenibacillus woosongensis]GIP56983.1 DNA-directed DNA polymerase [Paenibacillus woosongensis]
MNEFVHLHVHSEYSLLDGAARLQDLVAKAASFGMKALALTDHGVMYGAVPFYKYCKANGIKPIIGCEVYFTAGSRKERGTRKEQPIHHLILLAKNETGYRNLMKLSSIGHLEGFHYKPRIDWEALERHSEGLVCLSACLGGEVPHHLLHGRYNEARKAAQRYQAVFGEDFYIELQDHGIPEQKKVLPELIKLAEELNVQLVATNDVHYLNQEDAEVQDVLICIGTGKTIQDEERLQIPTDQLYLKSGAEMAALFPYVAEAVANTKAIADKCNLELQFGRHILPAYQPIPDGMTSEAYLASLCGQGLEERYGHLDMWRQEHTREQLHQRLHYELSVIGSMGFSDYFLIVWDFIAYAHRQGIATGPGRGSSAGSLVAYVLKITDVDPIKYNLLFERFLNPERVTMPDIDIDFSDERRDEVIAYVADKYGAEHVAQIITFGTMAARAAVRDVGRALNIPFGEVDKVAKLIPGSLGMTIERAIRESSELKGLYESQQRIQGLLDMARKVEGMPRHASTHAAGVVISRDPLTDTVPLQAGGEGTPLTQYSMEHLEAIGLLKMDFLGLRTLSIIERCMNWIREQEGEVPDFRRVSDDDPQTYEMLGRGETTGVFQLESAGMRRVLKDLKPSTFEDIISVLALYRPGPMEFIPKFIAGKHGQTAVEYPHSDLVPILKDTYGIIVYQEQIMQIASKMAGFSLGEADLLRRAVSKKKREVLDEERGHFVSGSLSQGYQAEDANAVYDMIVRFADYGFPRAHAAAYGVLAFQTAYLKAHYPVYFMASMLTAVMGSHRKVAEYIIECRRMGITVLPPDVNESGILFTPRLAAAAADGEAVRRQTALAGAPADKPLKAAETAAAYDLEESGAAETSAPAAEEGVQGVIRFGLAAIKNVGTQAMESILRERQVRPFDSLLDFCRRVDLRTCNKRVIESLIQGGAFDSLPGHRAQLLAMLDETVEAALKWRKEREDLQIQLFDFVETPNWNIEYPDIPPFSAGQQLDLERELLGLYLSGHPLDDYDELLDGEGIDRLMDLAESPDGSRIIVAGMVVSVKAITTKQGKAMAFMELEDQVERCEVVLFPEVWRRSGELVAKGALLALRATVQQQDEGFKLLADELAPLSAASLAQLRRSRGGAPRGAGGANAQPQPAARRGSDAALAASSRTAAAQRSEAPGAAAGGARDAKTPGQRVFIKISAAAENARLLEKLKALLQLHSGPVATVLYYESTGKLLALSERYSIKPSPELFQEMEHMLGPGTVRIK